MQRSHKTDGFRQAIEHADFRETRNMAQRAQLDRRGDHYNFHRSGLAQQAVETASAPQFLNKSSCMLRYYFFPCADAV